jgi:hypothetical protein
MRKILLAPAVLAPAAGCTIHLGGNARTVDQGKVERQISRPLGSLSFKIRAASPDVGAAACPCPQVCTRRGGDRRR